MYKGEADSSTELESQFILRLPVVNIFSYYLIQDLCRYTHKFRFSK